MSYEQKYLKYKHKYLELKNSLKGGNIIEKLNVWAEEILYATTDKDTLLQQFYALKTKDDKIGFILDNYSKQEEDISGAFDGYSGVIVKEAITEFREKLGVNEVINEYKRVIEDSINKLDLYFYKIANIQIHKETIEKYEAITGKTEKDLIEKMYIINTDLTNAEAIKAEAPMSSRPSEMQVFVDEYRKGEQEIFDYKNNKSIKVELEADDPRHGYFIYNLFEKYKTAIDDLKKERKYGQTSL